MAGKQRTKAVSRGLARAFAAEARHVLDGAANAKSRSDVRLAAIGAVNACVRAADAICIAALGEHAIGDDHHQAVTLVGRTPGGAALASKLKTALQHKAQWSYGVGRIDAKAVTSVLRAAEVLVSAAESRTASL